jgi:ribosomal protein S18 acetylase RimI-like enzyme
MLWRVRATLTDRPGSLAGLAAGCGRAGVNILGLQIFPAMDRVTDELVLRAPEDWGHDEVTGLLEEAGGTDITALPCTDAALGDQPTRYVMAARSILEQPSSFPDVAARLFDADPGGGPDDGHVMEVEVLDVSVQVHRAAPFTATELARGAALAELVTAVLGLRTPASLLEEQPVEHVVSLGRVQARVSGAVVGQASWQRVPDDEGTRLLHLAVDPAWRRRGIGGGLAREATRAAVAEGATELLVRTAPDNPAVMPMVLATGLRGRIRMTADEITVRIPVRQLAAPTR